MSSSLPRMVLGLATLVTLASSASAGAPPRLGTFEGKFAVVSSHDGRISLRMRPLTATFALSSNHQRLYVEYMGEKGRVWRQSMIVTRDEVTPSGDRVITYLRPQAGSRSGRYNLRRLSSYADADFQMQDMKGDGTVHVPANRELSWNNAGSGIVRTSSAGTLNYGWAEIFQGTAK